MKRFIWAEVVDFLNNNLEAQFEYTNCESTCHSSPKCCMTSFFLYKKVEFTVSSPNGWAALGDDRRTQVAIVVDPPCKDLQTIHQVPVTNKSLITGQQILNNLNNL